VLHAVQGEDIVLCVPATELLDPPDGEQVSDCSVVCQAFWRQWIRGKPTIATGIHGDISWHPKARGSPLHVSS
jgi:hypothetical protein